MKVLLTSDLHIQSGIYTDIGIDYIDYLSVFCKENGINDIIIAGDIFEKSSKINNDAFIPLFFKFMELKKDGFNIVIVLGNHDIFSVDNDSLVETFSVFGKVVKNLEQIKLGGRTIDLLPYTKKEDDIPSGGDLLITHLSIADFSFDNKYHVSEKAGFTRELFKDYDTVFTGHFHRPQKKGNVVYMGSPYQMNFGEIDQKKGFIVLDLESNKWDRHFYTEAPTYKKIKGENFQNEDVKNMFVQVEIEKKLDNYVKLKHLLYEKGALNVSPYFIENDKDLIVDDETKIDMNSSVPVMVKEYILDSIKAPNIDNKKLVKIFDKVLAEI